MRKLRGRCNRDRQMSASLTIEAALVVPIFLYAMVLFLSLFQFIRIQQEVQQGLDETARYYARNAVLLEQLQEEVGISKTNLESTFSEVIPVGDLVEDLLFQARFAQVVSKSFLDHSMVEGGTFGISIRAQADYYEDDEVDLCAYYDCKIPVLFFRVNELPCIQRVRMKNWTGVAGVKCYSEVEQDEEKDEEEEKEDIVYVTETGTRYHVYRDCTHLKLSVESCSYEQISKKRNKNGGKYSACQICCKNAKLGADSKVYITKEGDRYHVLGSCSGLKRTIKEMKRSEAEKTMPECSRCKKREGAATSSGKQEKVLEE